MGLSSDTAQMFHVKHLCLDETGIVTLCGPLSLGATETRRCARRTPHRSHIAGIANRRDTSFFVHKQRLAPKRV